MSGRTPLWACPCRGPLLDQRLPDVPSRCPLSGNETPDPPAGRTNVDDSSTDCLFGAERSPLRPVPGARRVGFDRWCGALPLVLDRFGRGPGENDALNWSDCDAVGKQSRRSRLTAAARSGRFVFGPVANDTRRTRLQNWDHAAKCVVPRAVLAAASGSRLCGVGAAAAADCLRYRSRSVSLGWFRAA